MGWQEILLIIIAAIVVVGGGGLYAVPRLRRRGLPAPTRPAIERPPTRGHETRPGGVAAPERAPEGVATAPPAPAAPPPVETAPPTEAPPVEAAPPVLERPEPTAGRLVRLRARLSRSQGSLGKGLLALLSRDRLDD